MKNYFIELFKDNNTVIIPGFGALSLTDRAKGEYIFMSYLKHNDGLLKNHIASVENISPDEAQAKIDAFVSEMNEKLRSGQKCEISGLGVLFLDKSGDVDFEAVRSQPIAVTDATEDSATDFVGKIEEIPVQEKEVEPVVEQIEEEIPVTIEEEVIEEDVQNEVVKEKESAVVEQLEKEEILGEAAIPVVAMAGAKEKPATVEDVIENVDAQVYTEQQQWEDDLEVPPLEAKIERPKKPIIEKAKFDKKKGGLGKTIAIAAIALLVVGAVPTFIYFDEIKAKLFGTSEGVLEIADGKQFEFENEAESTENHYEESTKEEVDTIVQEEAPMEEPVQTEIQSEPATAPNQMESNMNSSGNYQLIVGSFQNQQYANNFEKKMRAEGNSNASVFGPVSGFYMVSLGAFSTQQEAKNALAEKIGNYPKIWIMKSGN
ncbi:MAG: SPOR domain-containing protein [Bacteroidota bacterium]